jgi:hypothetical protein
MPDASRCQPHGGLNEIGFGWRNARRISWNRAGLSEIFLKFGSGEAGRGGDDIGGFCWYLPANYPDYGQKQGDACSVLKAMNSIRNAPSFAVRMAK